MLSILLALSVAAFLVSSVAGGGAGLLLMPVLVALLPAASAPAALSIGTATSSVSRLAVLRSRIRWDVVRWFVPTAVPFVLLGAWLLTVFPPVYVQLLLGLFLVGNLPAVFRRRNEGAVLPATDRPRLLLMIGAAAGLLSGFTGAVGLLFNRFYYRLDMGKEEIVATRAANEVLLHLVKLVLYASFGLLTPRAMMAGSVVAIGAVAASCLMPHVLRRLDEALFRRIGFAAMTAAGAIMATTASAQVIAIHGIGVALSVGSDEIELTTQAHGRQLSVEVNKTEGVVLENLVRPSDLPPEVRARIHRMVRAEEIVSIERTLGIGGPRWKAEFHRSGRDGEVSLPADEIG